VHLEIIQNGGGIADDATYIFYVFVYLRLFSTDFDKRDPNLKAQAICYRNSPILEFYISKAG
jgi:hypothetical protein